MWMSEINTFTLLSYLLLLYVFTSIIIASFIKREAYQAYDDNYEVVSKDTIEKWLKTIYKAMLRFRMYMKRVISLDDIFFNNEVHWTFIRQLNNC